MRPPYIPIFALLCTLALSGCAGIPNVSKDPNSLASRVGNFSPVKLNAENAERKAARLVTPLPKGTRDLDGRQENFDPTFGSPETEAEASGKSASTSPALTTPYGSPGTLSELAADQAEEHAKRAANQNVSAVNQSASSPELRSLPSMAPTPLAHLRPDSTDSSAFGKSENGRTTVFMETPAQKPILETHPAPQNVSQGFGCPPAGIGSIQPVKPSTLQPPQMTSEPSSGHGPARRRASVGVHPQVLSRQPAQLQTPAMMSSPTNRLSPDRQQVMLFRTPPQTAPERKNILQGQAPGAAYEGPSQYAQTYDSAGMDSCDDLSLVTAQNQRAKNVRITATARVKRLLPDDRKGNPHQRFLLGLSNGTTVLVAHNIDLAPYVPLQQGDTVTICGEYIWNEKGGVLHYTHHTTNSHHQGGYIQYNRQTYQ